MKRYLSFILVLGLSLMLASCSNAKETNIETAESENQDQQAITEAYIADTEAKEIEDTEAVDNEESAVEFGESQHLWGGETQDEAVPMPVDTKIYGHLTGWQKTWYSFSTGDESEISISILHKNEDDKNSLIMRINDENGEKVGSSSAKSDGRIITTNLDELTPNTTYYILLEVQTSDADIDYMVKVNTSQSVDGAYLAKVEDILLDSDIFPSANQDDAQIVPKGANISSTVGVHDYHWYAFQTEDLDPTKYELSITNHTPKSSFLELAVYDELGSEIDSVLANDDGEIQTLKLSQLKPSRVYFIEISARHVYEDEIDYTFQVNLHEKARVAAKVERPAQVFEEPFEINDTQVMFIENEAIFADEAKAREVLEPLAAIISEYPENKILIAGTTATHGTQEDCVVLSKARADAVKDVLVNAFGVVDNQIVTIGLGYEKDPFERSPDIDSQGNFVESEGRKNRRVMVLDFDSDMAQEIVNNEN